jgi:hypothetical protein
MGMQQKLMRVQRNLDENMTKYDEDAMNVCERT